MGQGHSIFDYVYIDKSLPQMQAQRGWIIKNVRDTSQKSCVKNTITSIVTEHDTGFSYWNMYPVLTCEQSWCPWSMQYTNIYQLAGGLGWDAGH